jgi:hypothetical protein
MMRRFSRKRRSGGSNSPGGEGRRSAIEAGEWLPRILEQKVVEATSLEAWPESGVPDTLAAIGRGARADGTSLIVSFSPDSASEAILGGLAAAQQAVEQQKFAGLLAIVAPTWSAGARRLLGLIGHTPYAIEPVAAPALAKGRVLVEAERHPRVLATDATQLASRLTSAGARAAFTRAAIALEGLAAKHGGCVRVGSDRLELVVLARRAAEIRIEGDAAVLEVQVGGRTTTPLAGADLAAALDGLEGQLRRRLNDRKVREGEEGLRGRVVAQLAAGSELRGLRPWPIPGSDLAVVDGIGVNAEGDPVVVVVREEIDWNAVGAVLECLTPLESLVPVLFSELAPPLRLGTPRVLLAAERFAADLERVLATLTIAYELRVVSGSAGAAIDLVARSAGEGAEEKPSRRGRRRGGRGRSGAIDEASREDAGSDEEEAEEAGAGRSRPRRPAGPAAGPSGPAADLRDEERGEGEEGGRGRGRRRRRPRRGRGESGEASNDESPARDGREGEKGRSSEGSARPRRPRFEELSLMDLDDAPAAREAGSSGDGEGREDANEDGSRRRSSSSRRGRRGGRGDGRGRSAERGESSSAAAASDDASGKSVEEEEDLVDADDLSEILARLADDEPEYEGGEAVEGSYDDEEDLDDEEGEPDAAGRAQRNARSRARREESEDTQRTGPRKRSAILVHADRDSLLSAILLARDIRQLEGIWIYPQSELMTFFRSIATDLNESTPIFVIGFSPSPARDVIQASSLYRGRLTWFDRHAWPPEDLVALRSALGADAVHGGENIDSTLPLVLEECSRRSRFSDKLVDLATGRFTQHDFERWGRIWRWRSGQIAEKSGDIRSDIAALLAGRPSDLAKEAALMELPPPPPEVGWVAAHDFRLVHFGGHVMVVLDVEPALDLHLSARVARERYGATLSLAHRVGESSFVFTGDEMIGKRALDYLAVAEHLADKLEWVEARPDADHVARFHVRDLDRHPERLDEVIGEIAMSRSLLER